MTVRLEVLPAATWADHVAAELGARLRTQPGLRLVLPTGDTPAPVYERLVGLVRDGATSLAGAELILLDEYLGLAAGNAARCDARLQRELIDLLAAPPAAVHLVDVDGIDAEESARRLEEVVARGIDLAVLGLGMNGHVGLNEPGSRPDDPTRVVRLAASSRTAAVERYGADPAPTAGITLGLASILAAREVWLLVTGERKAAVLARALGGREGPDCPASYLRRHAAIRVIADEPAATRLRPGSRRTSALSFRP